MNTIVTAFMSELHKAYLHGRGYTKKRFVYSRPMKGYTEHVRLKGSQWNHPDRPWSFNVEFGVEIEGHPATSREFPHTHTHAALQEIVKDATGDYAIRHRPGSSLPQQIMDRVAPLRQQVRVPDQSALLAELALHIEQASGLVFACRDEVRRLCLSEDFHDRLFAITRATAAGPGDGGPSDAQPINREHLPR